MQGEKVAVYIATGASSFVIITILLVVPYLYQQITDLHDEVMEGMNAFKVLSFIPLSRETLAGPK